MLKVIIIVMTVSILGCNSACSGTDIKNTAVGTVQCAVKYPADTLTQAADLARALGQSTTPIEYATRLIAWAENAKDSEFAMCVLTVIRRDTLEASTLSLLTVNTEVVDAIDKFRRDRFGDKQFEPPPASK